MSPNRTFFERATDVVPLLGLLNLKLEMSVAILYQTLPKTIFFLSLVEPDGLYLLNKHVILSFYRTVEVIMGPFHFVEIP